MQTSALVVVVVFLLESAWKQASFQFPYRNPFFNLFIVGMSVIIVAGLIATFGATYTQEAGTFVLRYVVGLFVVMAIFSSLKTEKQLGTLMLSFIAGAVVITFACAFSQTLGLDAMVRGNNSRFSAFYSHPNQFGMMMTVAIAFAMTYTISFPKRFLSWVVLAILIYGLLLSGSFTNFILLSALTLTIMFVNWLSRRSLTRVFFEIATMLVVLGLLYTFALPQLETLSPRVYRMMQAVIDSGGSLQNLLEEDDLASVGGRLVIYRRSLATLRDHPLGVGGDNSFAYIDAGHAHNMYMDALLSIGYLGFLGIVLVSLAWLGLALALLIAGIKLHLSPTLKFISLGTAFGLLSYFLSNQTSDSLGGTTIYVLWMLLGLALFLLLRVVPWPFSKTRGLLVQEWQP